MNIQDIVKAFKTHQLQYGLDGDSTQQELYKWKLVTEQIGHPNIDAEDFEKEILSILVNPLQTYPNGNIVFTNEFGYVVLLPHPRQNKTAFPCTMASEFDKERKIHCPEYMYMFDGNRMIRRIQKK